MGFLTTVFERVSTHKLTNDLIHPRTFLILLDIPTAFYNFSTIEYVFISYIILDIDDYNVIRVCEHITLPICKLYDQHFSHSV